MKKKKATPKSSPKSQINDTCTKAQQSRILAELERVGASGLTSISIRDRLNCLHPPGRIMELRERGYVIVTEWTSTEDHRGRKHCVARYVLISQGGKAA